MSFRPWIRSYFTLSIFHSLDLSFPDLAVPLLPGQTHPLVEDGKKCFTYAKAHTPRKYMGSQRTLKLYCAAERGYIARRFSSNKMFVSGWDRFARLLCCIPLYYSFPRLLILKPPHPPWKMPYLRKRGTYRATGFIDDLPPPEVFIVLKNRWMQLIPGQNILHNTGTANTFVIAKERSIQRLDLPLSQPISSEGSSVQSNIGM